MIIFGGISVDNNRYQRQWKYMVVSASMKVGGSFKGVLKGNCLFEILACPLPNFSIFPEKLHPALCSNPKPDLFTEGLQWTWQELTSPYLDSTTSQQGLEPCRVLPAPQVTGPATEVWPGIFTEDVKSGLSPEKWSSQCSFGEIPPLPHWRQVI